MSKDKLKTDDLDDFQKLYESMRSDEEDDEEDEDFESVIGGGKYLVRYTLINDDDEEVRTKEICGVIDEDAAREKLILEIDEEIDILSVDELDYEDITTEDDLDFLDLSTEDEDDED